MRSKSIAAKRFEKCPLWSGSSMPPSAETCCGDTKSLSLSRFDISITTGCDGGFDGVEDSV